MDKRLKEVMLKTLNNIKQKDKQDWIEHQEKRNNRHQKRLDDLQWRYEHHQNKGELVSLCKELLSYLSRSYTENEILEICIANDRDLINKLISGNPTSK